MDRVKATLRNSTQWYRAENRVRMRRHWKTRFPAANVPRWGEKVATDTFFSDTPGGNYGIPEHAGATMMQLYTGVDSHLTVAFPMKSEDQMPDTLRQLITERGAPELLVSDNAKAQTSGVVQDILRQYCIGTHYSEARQQNQNPAERRIQDVKAMSNAIMDRTGTPAKYWILVVLYVVLLMNHTCIRALGDKSPLHHVKGYAQDISALLHYRWWEAVYFYDDDNRFPSESREKKGRWAGVAENVGDVLTYKILDEETGQIVNRSVVRSALDDENVNLRAEHSTEDEKSDNKIVSTGDITVPAHDPKEQRLPKFSPEQLIGQTFLYDTTGGQRVRSEVIRKLATLDATNHQNIKFLVKTGDVEEVMGYVEL